MKRFLLILLVTLWTVSSHAQEMNCIVSVSSQQIEGTDKRVFETLQNAIYEFINNRKWEPSSGFSPEAILEAAGKAAKGQ